MALAGGIADDLLVNLAEDIEKGEQMEALGRALGYKPAAINRYTETNRIEGRVTCKGTRDMLFDWRQRVGSRDQHCKLKEALEEANLIMLSQTLETRDQYSMQKPAVREAEHTMLPQNHPKDIPHATDISSKKISESLTVLKCRRILGNVYKHKLCRIKMKPWDPNDYATLKDMHTRVTMVTKDAHGKDTKKTETLHGSEIFFRKVNDQLPNRILLSAPAGRGKTTAVAKMAYDWTHRIQGSGLEDLPLLFVLRLRGTSQYTSIGEAIKSQLLSDVDDITPTILETFIRANQDICHIIFDGLDEYAGIDSGSNIVRIMRFEEYQECRVLVTTRPHLDNFFNEGELAMVYTKMGIEGFSKEAITEYIDKFFTLNSDISEGQGLKAYLKRQALISELVITPLFCLMVCHLWTEDLLTPDIGTQTKLLDSVNLFLLQHANARSNLGAKITDIRFKKIISKLGEVALTGLLSDAKKLVFTPRDFRKVPSILDSACDLGIISKTTVASARLPQSYDAAQITIEFYHKLAQEHSAGKYLAHKTKKYLVRIQMSKLDRVLRKIKGTIGDYENLIRFAAGTDNALCIIIMKAILTNGSLDESERYRILLDCSSETTKGTEGIVSSLVERCVTSQTMVLKSPTVFTVVGMQNLPHQLKTQVKHVHLKDSTITTDVTIGLWNCFGSFTTLHHLTISDASLSFPPSPPELPHVTNLTAERVTSQSYEGLLSSLPHIRESTITINDAESDISQITCFQRTGKDQLTHFILRALPSHKRSGHGSLNYYKNYDQVYELKIEDCLLSPEITDMLWSYFGSFTTLHRLIISDSSLSFPSSPPELPYVTWLKAKRVTSQSYIGMLSSLPGLEWIYITIDDAERDISQITAGLQRTRGEQLQSVILASLPTQGSGHGSLKYFENYRAQVYELKIEDCLLSAEITNMLWSYFGSFTTLHRLTISDSSLSFPSSPPELPHVTMLQAERVTSQSYKGLLSSLPCLTNIDITIDDADRDISQITTGLQRTGREQLTRITLKALPTQGSRHGSLNYYENDDQVYELEIKDCLLSAEITDMLWSYFGSFITLYHLTISDTSLSFPPSPPKLPHVTKLTAERVTSQSYEGLLSSLPGLELIDITIDDAERDISQITAVLQRTGREQLTHIMLKAPDSLPSEKRMVSRETMRGLGLLIREHTKNLHWLSMWNMRCRDEEDWIDLVECCRHVNTMTHVWLWYCGTKEGGILDSHLKAHHTSGGGIEVCVLHDNMSGRYYPYKSRISHII